MNKITTAETLKAAQSEDHVVLLCSLQRRMAIHLNKILRDIATAKTLSECKRDLLKG